MGSSPHALRQRVRIFTLATTNDAPQRDGTMASGRARFKMWAIELCRRPALRPKDSRRVLRFS